MVMESNKSHPNGILLLDKAKGLSSNQAIQRVKRYFGLKKVGHVGTLDPMATGMLPICINETTKLADLLLADSKTYLFTLLLGEKTDTGDADGVCVDRSPVPEESIFTVKKLLKTFEGVQFQQPPMYSALKHKGKPLYEYARRGESFPRKAREINIYSIELVSYLVHSISVRVKCSSGTYMRVLGENIAEKLGTHGHLIVLRREFVSCFENYGMYDERYVFSKNFLLANNLICHDEIQFNRPRLIVSAHIAQRLINGQRILQSDQGFPSLLEKYVVFSEGKLIGLGEVILSVNNNWILKINRVIK